MRSITFSLRRRTWYRLGLVVVLVYLLRVLFFSPKSSRQKEIKHHNVLELVTRPDKVLDVHKHDFLQARLGRDERPDIFGEVVRNGVLDFWNRFQLPLSVRIAVLQTPFDEAL